MKAGSLFHKNFQKRRETPVLPDEAKKLIQVFLDQRDSPDFAFGMALNFIDQIFEEAPNDEELLFSLMENCVFTSISVTYFEHLFQAIYQNPSYLLDLINKFSDDANTREENVNKEGQAHVNFILNGGHCEGCPSCDHHADVALLVKKWEDFDLDFYVEMFLGMQTILFAMENLLYDVLPCNAHLAGCLSSENIMHLRKFIFKFTKIQQENTVKDL